jgi:hypothetical protein
VERHELRELIDSLLDNHLPEGHSLDDGAGSMSWVVSDDATTVLGIDVVAGLCEPPDPT